MNGKGGGGDQKRFDLSLKKSPGLYFTNTIKLYLQIRKGCYLISCIYLEIHGVFTYQNFLYFQIFIKRFPLGFFFSQTDATLE